MTSMPKKPTFTFALEYVTPALAQEWLTKNDHNRPAREYQAVKYSDDMGNRRWIPTHEGIAFDIAGQLLDGQHRLKGVVLSGEGQWFLVARGLPLEARAVVNIGATRTMRDLLSLNGVTGGHLSDLAAAAKLALLYEQRRELVWVGALSPSKPEILEFVEKTHDDLSELVGPARSLYRECRSSRPATIAALYLIATTTRHGDLFDEFMSGLMSGAGLQDGDPRLAVRKARFDNLRGQWKNQVWIAVVIKAWNAFVEDRPIKLARFTRSELPMPGVL